MGTWRCGVIGRGAPRGCGIWGCGARERYGDPISTEECGVYGAVGALWGHYGAVGALWGCGVQGCYGDVGYRARGHCGDVGVLWGHSGAP